MNTSQVQQGGRVLFPAFMIEHVYMREFRKGIALPADLSRWQETVDAMLDGIDAPGPVYLMVDQAEVRKSLTQRRPGVHVDGYWNPGIQAHGSPSSGGHGYEPPSFPRHGYEPPEPPKRKPAPTHNGSAPVGHGAAPIRRPTVIPESHPDYDKPHGIEPDAMWGKSLETLLIASNELGCRGFMGEFELPDWNMGDCSDVDVSQMDSVEFEPGRVWLGDTRTMLHESIAARRDFRRTVVRLNVPKWTN